MQKKCSKDNGIFAQLYDTQAEKLHRYVIARGARDDIDDIVHDAFLRLYDRMGDAAKPIEREKLVPYLYTIARNLVYDRHRHNNRTTQIEIGIDDTFLQSIPDTTPLPEEVYAEKELRAELDTAIETLPEKIAEAVKSLLEGKTFEMAAQEFGIQMPALKYRLRKAQSLLKNIM
jgi:RNA polymerase sigma-70 factor (ECF subfamily)